MTARSFDQPWQPGFSLVVPTAVAVNGLAYSSRVKDENALTTRQAWEHNTSPLRNLLAQVRLYNDIAAREAPRKEGFSRERLERFVKELCSRRVGIDTMGTALPLLPRDSIQRFVNHLSDAGIPVERLVWYAKRDENIRRIVLAAGPRDRLTLRRAASRMRPFQESMPPTPARVVKDFLDRAVTDMNMLPRTDLLMLLLEEIDRPFYVSQRRLCQRIDRIHALIVDGRISRLEYRRRLLLKQPSERETLVRGTCQTLFALQDDARPLPLADGLIGRIQRACMDLDRVSLQAWGFCILADAIPRTQMEDAVITPVHFEADDFFATLSVEASGEELAQILERTGSRDLRIAAFILYDDWPTVARHLWESCGLHDDELLIKDAAYDACAMVISGAVLDLCDRAPKVYLCKPSEQLLVDLVVRYHCLSDEPLRLPSDVMQHEAFIQKGFCLDPSPPTPRLSDFHVGVSRRASSISWERRRAGVSGNRR
ncbi:hypothetical protein PYCC9005_005692 [Savitreella phatthalungensis]